MSRSREYKPRSIRRGGPLTERELQVLALVAAGESTPAISKRLGIVENTIKSHLTSVYKKTGSANRVQAARYYLDHYRYSLTSDVQGGPPTVAGRRPLLDRQIRELEARLDELAPATREAQRLQEALSALRAIDAK